MVGKAEREVAFSRAELRDVRPGLRVTVVQSH